MGEVIVITSGKGGVGKSQGSKSGKFVKRSKV